MRIREKTLNCMSLGEKGIIKKVKIESDVKRRMIDLGIIPGAKIECVLRSPLGDPTAFLIKGGLIALRSNEAREIYIETESAGNYD